MRLVRHSTISVLLLISDSLVRLRLQMLTASIPYPEIAQVGEIAAGRLGGYHSHREEETPEENKHADRHSDFLGIQTRFCATTTRVLPSPTHSLNLTTEGSGTIFWISLFNR